MNTKMTAAVVVILLTAAFSTAQAQVDPAVKILPTNDKSIVKVLYAYDNVESVHVKFYNDDGLDTSETIEKNTFEHGFSKKYDIHRVRTKSFWIEVSDHTMSVTYKMIQSKDKKTYIPYLEKTVYNHPLVASNN